MAGRYGRHARADLVMTVRNISGKTVRISVQLFVCWRVVGCEKLLWILRSRTVMVEVKVGTSSMRVTV